MHQKYTQWCISDIHSDAYTKWCMRNMHSDASEIYRVMHQNQIKRFSRPYVSNIELIPGADLGGRCRGCAPSPHPTEMTCGFLIQVVFYFYNLFTSGHQLVTPFFSGAPPPQKNPGSAPEFHNFGKISNKTQVVLGFRFPHPFSQWYLISKQN